ncbi:MAG: ABC transporter substrate-binding protein [Lachnospiraceae bacterium]|nr:ABC transporter substrate-binding protein [Lachnospiraceae bacterium]
MKRKLIAALLVTAMATSLVACNKGGSASDAQPTTGGEVNQETGEFELDKIVLVINGTLTATVENRQDAFEQQWEDAVGIDLDIQQLDHSGYADAVGRKFVAGDRMDVILLSSDQYAQYAPTGALWDMSEAFKNASFQSRIKYPAVNEGLYRDGKLYGLAPAYGNGCVTYVKKAWLDSVGIDPATVKTFDDYYAMLEAFRDGDPDGDGTKGNTYGTIAAGYISEEAPYINYLPEFWQDAYPAILQGEDGVWYDGFQTDACKEAILRLAKGKADNVIDPTTLTNGTKDARESWFSNNQTGSSGAFTYWAGTWYQTLTDNLIKNEVDSEIVELEPIAEVGAYINREAPVFCIIDDGDGDNTREQAIFDKFFESMLDGGEVEMLWLYGAKDVHWSVSADEGFTINPGQDSEKVYGPYEEGEFHLLPTPNDPNAVWKKNAIDPALVICPLEGEYANYSDESSLMTEGNAFFTSHMKDAPSTPASELFTTYAADINTAKGKCIASVVVDGMDIDEAMAEYVSTVGDKVTQILDDLNSQSGESAQ